MLPARRSWYEGDINVLFLLVNGNTTLPSTELVPSSLKKLNIVCFTILLTSSKSLHHGVGNFGSIMPNSCWAALIKWTIQRCTDGLPTPRLGQLVIKSCLVLKTIFSGTDVHLHVGVPHGA